MYSPLGLVIFVAVERTFVCFTKGQDHLFQILFVAAAYEQTNAISRAYEAAYRNALAILAVVTQKWCGIHSLRWSTIPRIGRHSAGYS